MNETNERPTEPTSTSDFERSAKQAFDASVRGARRGDALADSSRRASARSTARAAHARDSVGAGRSRQAARSRRRRVVAVLAARASPAPDRARAAAGRRARRSRDLARRTRTSRCSTTTSISIRGSRSSPISRRLRRTAMAWADAANRGGLDRRALLRARGRGPGPARARGARARPAAPPSSPPKTRRPDLAFLEYLGSWQGDDDEWLAIKEWDQDAAPEEDARRGGKPPGRP